MMNDNMDEPFEEEWLEYDYEPDPFSHRGYRDPQDRTIHELRRDPSIWVDASERVTPIQRLGNGHLVNILMSLRRRSLSIKAANVSRLEALVEHNAHLPFVSDSLAKIVREVEAMEPLEVLNQFVPQWSNLIAEARARDGNAMVNDALTQLGLNTNQNEKGR